MAKQRIWLQRKLEWLTGPTQCGLPSKLNRTTFHLRLLRIALSIRVEFRLQLGELGLKLAELGESGVAFCLERAVSTSKTEAGKTKSSPMNLQMES